MRCPQANLRRSWALQKLGPSTRPRSTARSSGRPSNRELESYWDKLQMTSRSPPPLAKSHDPSHKPRTLSSSGVHKGDASPTHELQSGHHRGEVLERPGPIAEKYCHAEKETQHTGALLCQAASLAIPHSGFLCEQCAGGGLLVLVFKNMTARSRIPQVGRTADISAQAVLPSNCLVCPGKLGFPTGASQLLNRKFTSAVLHVHS